MALVARILRKLPQPIADCLQANGIGPVHRAAAPGRETVAVEPDHVDVPRSRRDALFEDARAFVDHRIDQPLDDFFLGNIAPFYAEPHRGIDDQLLDLRIGARRAALVEIEALAGLLAVAA